MELHTIRGGSKDELFARKYNIGVGISLGNKWFTPANIVNLITWSLQYTREYVVVYVADSIHSINEEVRGKMSQERAMARSLRKGDEIIQAVKAQVDQLISEQDKQRTVYVTWNEIVDKEYEQKMAYYIIHEMPELICRVPMSQYTCDAYVYPFDGEVTQLAEEIQLGYAFPEIKENIMDTGPKVFLEVR